MVSLAHVHRIRAQTKATVNHKLCPEYAAAGKSQLGTKLLFYLASCNWETSGACLVHAAVTHSRLWDLMTLRNGPSRPGNRIPAAARPSPSRYLCRYFRVVKHKERWEKRSHTSQLQTVQRAGRGIGDSHLHTSIPTVATTACCRMRSAIVLSPYSPRMTTQCSLFQAVLC